MSNTGTQIVTDHIIGLAVFVLAVTLYKHGEPRQRGFYCDDSSISLPYQTSSISGPRMWALTALLPLVPFVTTELVLRWHRRPLKRTLLIIYQLYCIFYWGYTITMASGEVLKQITGRLRPHFMTTCQPDVTEEQCGKGFIMEYNCTVQLTLDQLRELKKSFPSGHAMSAAYSATFVAYYIHHRWDIEHLSLQLRILVQTAVMLLAAMMSIDRVSEHHHHWQDVAVGFAAGLCMALWVVNTLKHRLPLRRKSSPSHSPTRDWHVKHS